ncbi:unnamed protein product [Rotaria magnacalcarata]|uniref:HTH psq-type domain-containing protein n=1 Tax=Rotaria magnacalcarata TaxID=392030 RepID=A0A819URV2_9BILA|nr:unnamed protein product [Rotaria magnacalcarata]CAF2152307.1 unnamed protein product [Rotaria magnacalcarata]CAF3900795.1 unnamed protein product [Rotaria magnacalcarata]CAF3914528.1 unnamed protein product [Rotaria magnacalcarata]CAF4045637.1 unnamed protein product [Rotaria magnacalcarata]
MLGQDNNLKNNNTEIGPPAEDFPRSSGATSFIGKSWKRLKNAAAHGIDVSERKLGKTFCVAQSTIHYNLNKIGLKYYKRQKTSKHNKSQLEQVSKKCRKM